MWNWDQGRLQYFQFDSLRKIAHYATIGNLREATHDELGRITHLPFSPRREDYLPWRNYSRVFSLSLIVNSDSQSYTITPVGIALAVPGNTTSDEYFHFLVRATTDPSPVLQGWNISLPIRFPLLFSIKLILTAKIMNIAALTFNNITALYEQSSLTGHEDIAIFIGLLENNISSDTTYRQANESLRVIGQLSYLNIDRYSVYTSLHEDDCRALISTLHPFPGPHSIKRFDEVQRITDLFPKSSTELEFDFPNTTISDTFEAGFIEGGRIERTHIQIERNPQIRRAFFESNPSPICDFCGNDTNKLYPWCESVLDIHHILPLSSGVRTSREGTSLDDLVANCPSCHRAVHRFYGVWMKERSVKDFEDANQAKAIYENAKERHRSA